MVSSSRPLNRSSSGRFTRRGPKNTATDKSNETHHHPSITAPAASASHQNAPSPTASTPTAPPDDDSSLSSHDPKLNPLLDPRAATSSQGPSRRKRATPIANSEHPRPPTEVTVTQPHGGLVQTTNGVQSSLNVAHDPIPSAIATPRPDGQRGHPAPGPASARSQDKRSLRSHDGGSRLKSDLAIYFPNYDEVIAGTERKPDFLDVDTPIYITDEPLNENYTVPTQVRHPSPTSKRRSSLLNSLTIERRTLNGYRPVAQVNSGIQSVDFSTIVRHTPHHITSDPLGDDVFFKAHRRAERKEKQLRNIEKERAMHEKVQLERLLDGLLGHDWLKVMGITGITDSEKKEYEPKRDYFIAEVRALVDKFRVWKEEEKRLRVEKEQAQHAKGEEEDDVEDEVVPDSSDEDAGAARQLQQEAISASGSSASKPKPPPAPVYKWWLREPSPEKPFTSFYSKPHLRAAALGQQRHGRNVTAFGQPIPELPEQEFCLPDDFITPEALAALEREKRRKRRSEREERSAQQKGRAQGDEEAEMKRETKRPKQ
ncbi:something about silencing, SAS, complex subunit 4-domain-containing protein [Phyllosticta citrichinensis]|uniref:Something about silencing, SAS, complex subunit 4-domain-containing protein n=1 Tax=Phyllosticta citrichinensis TaxID=1130410 RepID=A0ABR1XRA5_9PEZI